MLAFVLSPVGKYVLAALAALVFVGGGVLYLEHRGAVSQAEADAVATTKAQAAQADEVARENAATAAQAVQQQQAETTALQSVMTDTSADAMTVSQATKDISNAPDANADISPDLQRLIDGLRDAPAGPSPAGGH